MTFVKETDLGRRSLLLRYLRCHWCEYIVNARKKQVYFSDSSMRQNFLVGKSRIFLDYAGRGTNPYPTLAKGNKSSTQKCPLQGDMLVLRNTLNTILGGGGFKYFLCSSLLGKWSNLTNIFQMGWNHPLVLISLMHFDKHPGGNSLSSRYPNTQLFNYPQLSRMLSMSRRYKQNYGKLW